MLQYRPKPIKKAKKNVLALIGFVELNQNKNRRLLMFEHDEILNTG